MGNKKITKEEYLHAVDIIEEYHLQVTQELAQIKLRMSYTMSQFSEEYGLYFSPRLKNIMKIVIEEYGKTNIIDFNVNNLIWSNDGSRNPINVSRRVMAEFEELKIKVIRDKNLHIKQL